MRNQYIGLPKPSHKKKISNLSIYLLVGVNQRQMRFLAFIGFSTPLNAYTRIQR